MSNPDVADVIPGRGRGSGSIDSIFYVGSKDNDLNLITGGEGDDTLYGGEQADSLCGDVLYDTGDARRDPMQGDDVFAFKSGDSKYYAPDEVWGAGYGDYVQVGYTNTSMVRLSPVSISVVTTSEGAPQPGRSS